jgi:hypothetical protein
MFLDFDSLNQGSISSTFYEAFTSTDPKSIKRY